MKRFYAKRNWKCVHEVYFYELIVCVCVFFLQPEKFTCEQNLRFKLNLLCWYQMNAIHFRMLGNKMCSISMCLLLKSIQTNSYSQIEHWTDLEMCFCHAQSASRLRMMEFARELFSLSLSLSTGSHRIDIAVAVDSQKNWMSNNRIKIYTAFIFISIWNRKKKLYIYVPAGIYFT